MGRREAEHETETAPADRHPDLPATGRRAVKPRPPQPTGGRQPWDGGKRNMKPRPPLLRRKRRLWTFLVRPGRSRFHSAPETARQGRSRFHSAPETARQGRPRFQPTPKTARHGWPRFQPTPKTARQGRPRFQPAPKTARHGRPRFQPAPETARQGRPGFQPAPKTARHGRPRFQPTPLEQRSGRAGADATAALGRAVGTCPAITPRIHHLACPLPLRPLALWCRRSMKCHTHPECTRLSLLTEPPARLRGALRS